MMKVKNALKLFALEFTRCLFGLAEGLGFVGLLFLIFGRTQDGVLGIIQVWNDSVQKNGLLLAMLIDVGLILACYLLNRVSHEMVDMLKPTKTTNKEVDNEV